MGDAGTERMAPATKRMVNNRTGSIFGAGRRTFRYRKLPDGIPPKSASERENLVLDLCLLLESL